MSIVQGISIEVFERDLLVILGPNGSGKSTFVKAIIGEANVLQGRVLFKNTDVTSAPASHLIEMGISYVPQVANIFEPLTVRENLELGAYRLKDKEKIDRNMRDVFNIFPVIQRKLDKKARTLSGGERQLLAIGRGLMTKPVFLMLDEPSASLAPNAVSQIFEHLEVIRNAGVTMILVEQNAEEALRIGTRVIVLISGMLVYRGDDRLSFESQKLMDIMLGKMTDKSVLGVSGVAKTR
jgi:branched-chain amino acid transport system ATP-binding protein